MQLLFRFTLRYNTILMPLRTEEANDNQSIATRQAFSHWYLLMGLGPSSDWIHGDESRDPSIASS